MCLGGEEELEVKTYKKIRGNLYEVKLSNGEKYKLYDDVILKYELLTDKCLDERRLAAVISENAKMDAYFRGLKYISTKMRSKTEIREYLKKHDCVAHEIDYAVAKLEENGYLNERRYAEAYINDAINLGKNGPHKIKESLAKLGIAYQYIDEFLSSIDATVWQERIDKILQKRAKTNKAGDSLFKSKMYSELVALGYYQEDIKAVLEKSNFTSYEIFEKEANKVYDKLAIKYSGHELEMRFKSKMYAKGFTGEQISNFLRFK